MLISRRRLLQLSVGALLTGVSPRVAWAGRGAVLVETGPAFGSAWRMVLPDTRDANHARMAVEAVVQRVDALMSPFRRTSDLSRFNQGAGGVIKADPTTCQVVKAALALADDSGGAFDPTSAPLGRRFGFGVPGVSAERPVGRYRDIQASDHTLHSDHAGVSLDLCGIAKGYALDEIVARLEGLDFLIELGGEVIARGAHPIGRPWLVGIERPGHKQVQRVIKADGRALATSGDAINGYATPSGRYAHVVDPRTGRPVDNGIASVSVLAPTGQLADGLATAAMVLGPDQARGILAAHDASALFLMRDTMGDLIEVDVLGFVRGAGA